MAKATAATLSRPRNAPFPQERRTRMQYPPILIPARGVKMVFLSARGVHGGRRHGTRTSNGAPSSLLPSTADSVSRPTEPMNPLPQLWTARRTQSSTTSSRCDLAPVVLGAAPLLTRRASLAVGARSGQPATAASAVAKVPSRRGDAPSSTVLGVAGGRRSTGDTDHRAPRAFCLTSRLRQDRATKSANRRSRRGRRSSPARRRHSSYRRRVRLAVIPATGMRDDVVFLRLIPT